MAGDALCPDCLGWTEYLVDGVVEACPACSGTGRVNVVCPVCSGTGEVDAEINVALEAMIVDLAVDAPPGNPPDAADAAAKAGGPDRRAGRGCGAKWE